MIYFNILDKSAILKNISADFMHKCASSRYKSEKLKNKCAKTENKCTARRIKSTALFCFVLSILGCCTDARIYETDALKKNTKALHSEQKRYNS